MRRDSGRAARVSLWLRLAFAVCLVAFGTLTLVGQGGGATTARVSVSSTGGQASGGSGYWGLAISADGRFVAFQSDAANLVSGDTNGLQDVFVHDRQLGTTTRVSVSSAGSQGNASSGYSTSLSADGRFVAFQSNASNLVSGDTNGAQDVFVHDRQTGATTCESISSAGTLANGGNYDPSLSADGRFVAFASNASNLVSGDTNAAQDVFMHDRQTGSTIRASLSSGGVQGNSSSGYRGLCLSADGRFVAFASIASNLISGDINGKWDTFVHDRLTGATTRVSGSSGGDVGNRPSISADGRFVAFESTASDLVAGDTNGWWDIFVHDRVTGLTARLSVTSGGVQSNHDSYYSSISADGRFVAFNSSASNLVPGDTNGAQDVFVKDWQTGATTRVSLSSGAVQGNSYSLNPMISADGRLVAFDSTASNLVTGDTNSYRDVFVHDRGIIAPALTVTIAPTSISGGGFAVGTVTFSQQRTSNTTVTLSSSNTAVATVPASVTVPANNNTAQFAITTKPVAASTSVTITATYNGTSSASLQVTATPYINAGPLYLSDGTHAVNGILCDNFRETPPEERDGLDIRPYGPIPVLVEGSGYVCTQSGTAYTAQIGGTVEFQGGSFRYYPPLEFNKTLNPTVTGQLDLSPTRVVYVRAQFKDSLGRWYKTDISPVVIARPPMVLVHGINNDATNWKQFALNLRSYGDAFPFMTADHGGANEPFYHGRGTVEGAASSVKTWIGYVLKKIRAGQPWNPGIIDDTNETWDDPYTAFATVGPLAAKRVDVVAHSYGGVVARWLTADHNSASAGSGEWYLRRGLGGFSNIQPGKFQGQVRKVITLGSMWRGTPVASLANEINLGGDGGYGDAPFDLAAFADIRSFFRTMPPLKDERYPAFQVMAVESPWLRYLNLGVFPNGLPMVSDLRNFPFRESIGYASIAGDDSDYLGYPGLNGNVDFSLFGKVDDWQQPTWFPYLRMEEAVQQQKNYSDGIVPIWSAAIPGSFEIHGLDHDDLIQDAAVVKRVLLWLNSASLKSGKELNPLWNSGDSWPRSNWPKARGDNYQWVFPSTDHMAPWPQRLAYTQGSVLDSDGVTTRYVGRLNTTYTTGDYQSPKFQVMSSTATSVTVRFNTAAAVTSLSGTVFRLPLSVQAAGIPVTSYATPLGPGQITVTLTLNGSLPTGSYYIILAWNSNGVHGSAKVGASITSQTFVRP